jgi:hypothetical protein
MATAYALPSDGDTYFATRLYHDVWDSASDDDKTRALTTAADMIDRLIFAGSVTDPNQDRQFPRGGDTLVPNDIMLATIELANSLLDGVENEQEERELAMKGAGYGSVRTTYERSFPRESQAAGIPNVLAWKLLRPYLADVTTMILRRVS